MLTLKQLRALVESYGARPERWPQSVRSDAEALLADSAAARRVIADAQELDGAIEAARAREDAMRGSPAEQAAALARLRARVAARIAPGSARVRAPQRPLFGRALHWRPSWVGLAAAACLVAVAGLALGSVYGSTPPADHVLALLEPAPLSILADQ